MQKWLCLVSNLPRPPTEASSATHVGSASELVFRRWQEQACHFSALQVPPAQAKEERYHAQDLIMQAGFRRSGLFPCPFCVSTWLSQESWAFILKQEL